MLNRDKFKALIHFLVAISFIASCSADSPNSPESQPVPILGSGNRLFTFEDGSIECFENYNNDPTLVACVGVVSSGGAGKRMRDSTAQLSSSQATGYASNVVSYAWQPLQVTSNSQVTSVSNMQVSTDGIMAVYTLPANIASGFTVLATLQLVEMNSNQVPEQDQVQTTSLTEYNASALTTN